MYLAPLNYDRFFKKVFSDINTAKQFLEDVLEVNITSITPLPLKHKITDNSTAVEFDYRCEIDGPKNCLKEGLSIEITAKISGLSVEEVTEIANDWG
jgi:hypothetical protein